MVTECYAPVRGSAIRVTGLERNGAVPDPLSYAVSKSVVKVQITESSEGGSSEVLRNEENERRLVLRRPAETIRYMVDIDFLKVDPGLLGLVAGVQIIYSPTLGDVVGFDARTKLAATSFALEVWSKLAGAPRALGFGESDFGEDPFGDGADLNTCADRYGYTLFPFLKGGWLSGFSFANGLVSFNLRGAQTRRAGRWGYGPYALDGEPYTPLISAVSGNTSWRQTIVYGAPPTPTCGVETLVNVIDGGTATMTSSDVIDGEFVTTSSHVVDGGAA